MNLPSNNSGESSKKFSRGRFLRDSVITASGIALLPSILSGCNKLVFQPGKGYGSGPAKGWGGTPTPNDIQNAVANLTRMRRWVKEVYDLTLEYDEGAFKLLNSTRQNKNWANFIGNIFIDIGIGIAGAVGVLSGATLAIPAFACLSAFIKDWGIGKETPPDLNGAFAVFQIGHNAMQIELLNQIDHLTTKDATGVYTNLLTNWKDEIEFQGKSYTLLDLANCNFPDPSDEYDALRDNALINFRQSLWNLIIMKTCTLYYYKYGGFTYEPDPNESILDIAILWYHDSGLGDNQGYYLRGTWLEKPNNNFDGKLSFVCWSLGLDGYPFPDDACNVLFKDDVPGHIINPEGLFTRSYVYEQFSTTKYPFKDYGEELGFARDFDYANSDYEYTGGVFPSLIKI
ncbi:MAG: hypothetical protein ABI091_04865 [Ferruginibacter sp.]